MRIPPDLYPICKLRTGTITVAPSSSRNWLRTGEGRPVLGPAFGRSAELARTCSEGAERCTLTGEFNRVAGSAP